MSLQETVTSHCPYCGEPIELVVDCSISRQHYIEDCEVCCRPIEINVEVDEGGNSWVDVKAEFD